MDNPRSVARRLHSFSKVSSTVQIGNDVFYWQTMSKTQKKKQAAAAALAQQSSPDDAMPQMPILPDPRYIFFPISLISCFQE